MKLRIPSEHEPHRGVWMAWPYRADEWTDLAAAQQEHAALVRAIAETERVELLVDPSVDEVPASQKNVAIHRVAYGDAWVRDSGPIVAQRPRGALQTLTFDFDGWGDKFPMPGDADLSQRLAAHFELSAQGYDYVFEGGGIELDGEGTLLTTASWVRRLAERSAEDEAAIIGRMERDLGVERVLVVEAMLANDHTDGHVDTLCRFIEPGRVVAMRGTAADPNGAMLLSLEQQLTELVDARGRRLQVATMPSPGIVQGTDGELMPASYANYYLANGQVLVPTYGVDADEEAVHTLARLFPDRRVRGLDSRWILEGGGAFHCITQQIPA